jgi:hypothetical protein
MALLAASCRTRNRGSLTASGRTLDTSLLKSISIFCRSANSLHQPIGLSKTLTTEDPWKGEKIVQTFGDRQVISTLQFLIVSIGNRDNELFAHSVQVHARYVVCSVRQAAELDV